MTDNQDPVVFRLLAQLRPDSIRLDSEVYLDILRALVCDSLEACIDAVDRMARECALRSDTQKAGARYISTYECTYHVFSPYLDDRHRLLAFGGDLTGILLVISLDNQKPARPESIAAYRYDTIREDLALPDLRGLLKEVAAGDHKHAIAMTGIRRLLDDENDIWSRSIQRLVNPDGWQGLFRAINAAATMHDLVGGLTQELEDQFRRRYVGSQDLGLDAAVAVAMKLGSLDHSLDGIAGDGTRYRTLRLKSLIEAELRRQGPSSAPSPIQPGL